MQPVYRIFDFDDPAAEAVRLEQQMRAMAAIEAPLYERHGVFEASSLLDVGCGTGAPGRWLASRGIEVFGVDAVREAVRAASPPRAVAAGEHLPFADRSFDVTYARLALQHAPEPARVVREMGRVARRRVVVVDTDLASFVTYPDLPTGTAARATWASAATARGADAFVGRRLRALFVDAGLDDVRTDVAYVTSDALGREVFARMLLTPHVRVLHARDAATLARAEDELRIWIDDPRSFGAAALFVASGRPR